MSAKRLRFFVFEPDFSFLPHDETGDSTPEGRQLAGKIEDARRSVFRALDTYIYNALLKAKAEFGDPPIDIVRITLTRDPKPAPYFEDLGKLQLFRVDVLFDPMDLLNMPQDKDKAGELVLGLAEEALAKLETWPGFPTDVVRGACEDFRAAGYLFPFRAGEKMIPGTRVKGRVTAATSCISTVRYLILLYRNEPKYRMKISEQFGTKMGMNTAKVFSGFSLEGDILTVLVGPELLELDGKPLYANGAEPVSIDLKDHPEALELIRAHPAKT